MVLFRPNGLTRKKKKRRVGLYLNELIRIDKVKKKGLHT